MGVFISNSYSSIEASHLRDENKRLEDENARLRSCLSDDADDIREIMAENAKLRELSKYAILCSEGDVRCEACPYHDKTREPHIICTMRKAARELRVEVTE